VIQAGSRERFLDEVLRFVRSAANLPGVLRIALVGSILTDRPDPKDVDVLVSVADDAELAPLAALGRRLQGRLQSLNHGADVFLADGGGRYLGRTCSWKACGPGIRASCDALHCGRRPYLHDDLATVRLAGGLVTSPPVELWPVVVRRCAVPADVERLLAHLSEPHRYAMRTSPGGALADE